MQITIDRELCEGNAVCEALAPSVFELDDDDQARIIAEASDSDGEVGEEHRVLVDRAAVSCPRLAITVSG